MTTFALHTPVNHQTAVELSARTYRKQVLPKGSIEYKGRTITFDDAYLTELATSFVDRAFDQVGFMLAPADNSHTLDPERFRGEVKALETASDGLYAIVEFASDEAAQAVVANPKLGVSARIVEQYDRADGKHFDHAIQHVLGTLDPRVTGMKAWEPISLSNNDLQVLDLSSLTFDGKGAEMADEKITEEDRKKFDTYLTELGQLAPEGDKTPPADKDAAAKAKADADAVAKQAADDAALDAELQKLLEGEGADSGANLSSDDRKAIDLANARTEQVATENAKIREELDLANFDKEKAALISKGVPPAMVDLAMPLLLGKEHVIELSNATKVDAGEIVRKLLTECEGLVDLSGETVPAPGANSESASMLAAWEKQNPMLTKS